MRKVFAILSLITMMSAASVCAYASDSQEATTIEPTTTQEFISENPSTSQSNTEEPTTQGGNTSPISPKTGDNSSAGFAFALLFTGMGSAILAKKKLSE